MRRAAAGLSLAAAIGAAACVAMILIAILTGCSMGAQSPERASARAAVLTVAEGLHQMDELCAEVALTRKDRDLALKCAGIYDVGRTSVLAAASAVDAWESGTQDGALCSLSDAMRSMDDLAYVLGKARVQVPPVLQDGKALAAPLASRCHR